MVYKSSKRSFPCRSLRKIAFVCDKYTGFITKSQFIFYDVYDSGRWTTFLSPIYKSCVELRKSLAQLAGWIAPQRIENLNVNGNRIRNHEFGFSTMGRPAGNDVYFIPVRDYGWSDCSGFVVAYQIEIKASEKINELNVPVNARNAWTAAEIQTTGWANGECIWAHLSCSRTMNTVLGNWISVTQKAWHNSLKSQWLLRIVTTTLNITDCERILSNSWERVESQ